MLHMRRDSADRNQKGFYCKQANHCGKGMTLAINPTANKTQAMFKQMAIAQNGTANAAASAATTLSTATASATAAAVASTASTVAGTGIDATGNSCTCQVLCGVADFPNAALQGRAAFGGMSGKFSHIRV
jgi:hypothetical protein